MMHPHTRWGDRDAVYVVRSGGVLFWPNGQVRGQKGYAVRGDDPFIKHYFRNGVPAMLERCEDAVPVPPSEWPQTWRSAAGPDYYTPEETAAVEAARVEEAAKAESEAEKTEEISEEIPPVDED